MASAAGLHAAHARDRGDAALRRIELLRLRFREGLPIRDIAALWQVEARKVHAWYEQARKEFERCLRQVVEFHHPGAPAAAAAEFRQVVEILGAAEGGRDAT